MRKRKPLTDQALADAERLKTAWTTRAQSLGIGNQTDMAYRCGWTTQGAFTQYLNGIIPLNLRALVRIANALKIEPDLISPTLARDLVRTPGSHVASEHGIYTTNVAPLTAEETTHLLTLRRLPSSARAAIIRATEELAKA